MAACGNYALTGRKLAIKLLARCIQHSLVTAWERRIYDAAADLKGEGGRIP